VVATDSRTMTDITPQEAVRNRSDAKRARPPSDDEPWVLADDTGLRVTFRNDDAAHRWKAQSAHHFVNATVTYEPATVAPLPAIDQKVTARRDLVNELVVRKINTWPDGTVSIAVSHEDVTDGRTFTVKQDEFDYVWPITQGRT